MFCRGFVIIVRFGKLSRVLVAFIVRWSMLVVVFGTLRGEKTFDTLQRNCLLK